MEQLLADIQQKQLSVIPCAVFVMLTIISNKLVFLNHGIIQTLSYELLVMMLLFCVILIYFNQFMILLTCYLLVSKLCKPLLDWVNA